MAERTHEVTLRHRVGPLALEVEFTLAASWTVLFAPSGGGKTTVLRLIAGLDRPDAARIVVNGRVLVDTAERIFVPAHQRGVGLVAQRPALFPNRDVLGNITYGARGRPVEDVMELCCVVPLRNASISQLSGGERQRVALARALAGDCESGLLLLDEPFTGMDDPLRYSLLAELKSWVEARGLTVLMVTHELGEIFAAGATVIRLEQGRVQAAGAAEFVLGSERERLRKLLKGGSAHHGL